jgi:hypothetical protein
MAKPNREERLWRIIIYNAPASVSRSAKIGGKIETEPILRASLWVNGAAIHCRKK